MNGPKFIYDDGREAELEWRPIKTVAQAKAPQPRPPYHLRGRESGGPFLIDVPSVESVTVPSFDASMKGGDDGSLVVNLPMNSDGSELKPVSIGEVVWAGSGIDRRRVAFLGGQGSSTSRLFPIEIDRRWNYLDLQTEARGDSWIDFDARRQASEILHAHDFPSHWGVETERGRVGISFGDGSGFGHAWAWIGPKLCWAPIPEHGHLDRSESRSDCESAQIPTKVTWRSCQNSEGNGRRFQKAFPLGAPFHWALWVINYVHAQDVLRRNWDEFSDPNKTLGVAGKLGFDLGQFMAEHRLRQLHSRSIDAHHQAEEEEADRRLNVIAGNESRADKRWRDYALAWCRRRREDRPAHGQGALADELIKHFDDKAKADEPIGRLPKRAGIIAQISKWEKKGQLKRSTGNPVDKARRPPN